METCLRGFSFIPENKVEVIDMQYIEGGELSRAWKTSRRQRMKDLETKIWEEFVKERDIVSSICSDDPYQFLERLPEDCLKELMDAQLSKTKIGKPEEASRETINEQLKAQNCGDDTREPRNTMVSFADEPEGDNDIIHIFDDEREDDVSGPEQEPTDNSTDSPRTAREPRDPAGSPGRERSPGRDSPAEGQVRPVSEKSSENARNMIETSIYSAKVKEVQSKVNLELLAVITSLEAHDLNKIEPHELPKLRKQCSEFCARFNRIYLYQLQRQVHDMSAQARHSSLRAQLVRALSLHQNLLQALQVFHKWFTQKAPLRECVDSLNSFTQIISEGDALCPAELHNEELQQTCANLNGVVNEYLQKLEHFLALDTVPSSQSNKSRGRHPNKKRSFGHCKPGQKQKSEADTRLSMYSLDTLRVNSKHSSFKDTSGGTSKVRLGDANPSVMKPEENAEVPQKKKTPRSRRPLMRAPGGAPRPRGGPREPDNIPTMVETIAMCASSHMSDSSPRASRPASPRRRASLAHARAPRGIRKGKNSSPRRISPRPTPRSVRKPMSPPTVMSQDEPKLSLHSVKVTSSETALSPVIKVQYEKKERTSPAPKLASEQSTPRGSTPRPTGSTATTPRHQSPTTKQKEWRADRMGNSDVGASCDVSRLLRRLCGSSGGKHDRVSGAKNAQLLCVNGGSPRQPSTPQLLRILEETIQKKAPKPQYYLKPKVKDVDRFRLTFNVTAKAADALFQYRTKFVQHMLTSPMYANSAVGKPWEMIGTVSGQIIDEILVSCVKDMELEDFITELYRSEIQ